MGTPNLSRLTVPTAGGAGPDESAPDAVLSNPDLLGTIFQKVRDFRSERRSRVVVTWETQATVNLRVPQYVKAYVDIEDDEEGFLKERYEEITGILYSAGQDPRIQEVHDELAMLFIDAFRNLYIEPVIEDDFLPFANRVSVLADHPDSLVFTIRPDDFDQSTRWRRVRNTVRNFVTGAHMNNAIEVSRRFTQNIIARLGGRLVQERLTQNEMYEGSGGGGPRLRGMVVQWDCKVAPATLPAAAVATPARDLMRTVRERERARTLLLQQQQQQQPAAQATTGGRWEDDDRPGVQAAMERVVEGVRKQHEEEATTLWIGVTPWNASRKLVVFVRLTGTCGERNFMELFGTGNWSTGTFRDTWTSKARKDKVLDFVASGYGRATPGVDVEAWRHSMVTGPPNDSGYTFRQFPRNSERGPVSILSVDIDSSDALVAELRGSDRKLLDFTRGVGDEVMHFVGATNYSTIIEPRPRTNLAGDRGAEAEWRLMRRLPISSHGMREISETLRITENERRRLKAEREQQQQQQAGPAP